MSSRPITLELGSLTSAVAADAEHRAALIGVVEDLVSLLEAQFPEHSDFPADALRMRLQQSRERLRSGKQGADSTTAGRRLVADASQAHARLAGHTSAREAEFLGVIRLLRELVEGLRGDASAFRDDLRRSSERVAELTRLEDIRVLRQALNREVEQLRHCVQQGERREASRMAGVDGRLRTVDATMTAPAAETRDRVGGLLARPALLEDLAAAAHDAATLVICRIDDPDAIVEGHGAHVLERVVIAVAQLLKGTFGKETRVYRSGTQCVAMFLPQVAVRTAAQQLRRVQARVAPEYEYERLGVTRRVVFTFSGVVTRSAARSLDEAATELARAESGAAALVGLAQLRVESSGLDRVIGWFAPSGL